MDDVGLSMLGKVWDFKNFRYGDWIWTDTLLFSQKDITFSSHRFYPSAHRLLIYTPNRSLRSLYPRVTDATSNRSIQNHRAR